MSELITVAIVGAVQALGAIIINAKMTAWTDAQKVEREKAAKEQKEAREELARKVEEHNAKIDQHNTSIARKLDVNTQITESASVNAQNAFVEANNFNERLVVIETELKTSVETELKRMSDNLDEMRNKLTIIVGEIPWKDRPKDDDPK